MQFTDVGTGGSFHGQKEVEWRFTLRASVVPISCLQAPSRADPERVDRSVCRTW